MFHLTITFIFWGTSTRTLWLYLWLRSNFFLGNSPKFNPGSATECSRLAVLLSPCVQPRSGMGHINREVLFLLVRLRNQNWCQTMFCGLQVYMYFDESPIWEAITHVAIPMDVSFKNSFRAARRIIYYNVYATILQEPRIYNILIIVMH